MGVIIDLVLDIDVADDVITGRLSGRRVCGTCGNSYHIEHKKPAVDGVCDKCQGTLVQRKDDEPATVLERLRVYHEQTEPLKDYYRGTGKLREIPGVGSVEEITARVMAALEA